MIPSDMIAKSFMIQKGLGSTLNHLLLGSLQKVSNSIVGGNINASALLATAPIKVMRSSRSGILRARDAMNINNENRSMY